MCKKCLPDITLKEIKKYRNILNRVQERVAIKILPALHNEAFSKINCLNCANCCKNHSPTFKPTDVKRISKFLTLKEDKFIETYLRRDEENDLVTKSSPCPFLENDNTCKIYEVRPSDCARYPYTNEEVLIKKKALTLKNVEVCPAVSYVLNKLDFKTAKNI